MACLLAAVLLGVGAVVRADAGRNGSPFWGLVIAFCLVTAGVVLLFAQARYAFWRRTAGIVSPRPGERDALEQPSASELAAQRWDWLILVNLIVLACIPRLVALFHSYWYDELWTLDFMRHGPLYALTQQQGYNNHPLNSFLGSLCLRWYQSFAALATPPVLPPTWVARMPAFLFGISAPALLYATARRHIATPAALAAGALLALSPAAIDFSTQARGYSALLFFTIAQAYWLSKALRTSAATAWLYWLGCTALGVLAHLYFVFVLFVDLIFIVGLAVWVHSRLMDGLRARALVEQGVTLTLAWVPLAVAGYARMWNAIQETMNRFAGVEPMARAHDVVVPMLQAWGGIPRGGFWTVYCIACALLIVLGVRALAKRPSGAAFYLPLILIVPPLLVEIAHPHYVYMRFFLFMLPAFLTLLACGMWELAVWIVGPKRERATYQMLALGLCVAGFFLLTFSGVRDVLLLPKQDYAGAAQRLQEEIERGRMVTSMGLGAEYFKFYAPQIQLKKKEAQLRDLLQAKKSLLVVDTGLVGNPSRPQPALTTLIKRAAGAPLWIFPGRFRDWPARWLDGDSDMSVYELKTNELPPTSARSASRRKGLRPSAAVAPSLQNRVSSRVRSGVTSG